MMALPEFTEDGLLPPGDYVMTIEELKRSRQTPVADAGSEGGRA